MRELLARVANITFSGKRRTKEPAVEFLGDAASYCWQTVNDLRRDLFRSATVRACPNGSKPGLDLKKPSLA